MTLTDRTRRLPTGPLIIAGVAITFMVVWSVVHWPEMAPAIVTREAAGNHGASVVPRGVTAVVLPVALLVLTVLLMVVPTRDAKLTARISPTVQQRGRGAVRILGALLVGLSIFFGVFHVGLIGMYTGADLPIEQVVGAAAGVLLMILGVYLPLARPDTTYESPRLEAFRAALGPAYRIGGFAMVALGLATIVVAIVRPALGVFVASAGVGLIFVAMVVTSLVKAVR